MFLRVFARVGSKTFNSVLFLCFDVNKCFDKSFFLLHVIVTNITCKIYCEFLRVFHSKCSKKIYRHKMKKHFIPTKLKFFYGHFFEQIFFWQRVPRLKRMGFVQNDTFCNIFDNFLFFIRNIVHHCLYNHFGNFIGMT